MLQVEPDVLRSVAFSLRGAAMDAAAVRPVVEAQVAAPIHAAGVALARALDELARSVAAAAEGYEAVDGGIASAAGSQ